MKYTYECSICSYQITIDIPLSKYNPSVTHTCINATHPPQEMDRVWNPTQVQFIGEGFTGAQGNLPKMDKAKRVKDLASKTDVEEI